MIPEIVAAYRAKYGLTSPCPQYILYMKNLYSLTWEPTRTINRCCRSWPKSYPATIELALFAIVIAAI